MSGKGAAFLLLEAGGQLFGLDLSFIEAVIPYRTPDPVPFQRSSTLGALLHRGRFLGVADLGRMLGLPASEEESRAVIAVIERGGAYVGLVASASHGLLREAEIEEEARVLGKYEGPFHLFSVKTGSHVAHVIDLAAMLEELSGKLERSA